MHKSKIKQLKTKRQKRENNPMNVRIMTTNEECSDWLRRWGEGSWACRLISFSPLVDRIVINSLGFLQCYQWRVRLAGKWTKNEQGRFVHHAWVTTARVPLGLFSVITLCRCPNPVFSFLWSLSLSPSWCPASSLFPFPFISLFSNHTRSDAGHVNNSRFERILLQSQWSHWSLSGDP